MLDLRSLVPWGHKGRVPAHFSGDRDPIISFRHEVDRLFDDFLTGFASNGMNITRNGGSSAIMPAIDIEDGEKAMVITAEVPGVDEKDLDVTLEGDVLTIHGEKKYDHEDKQDDHHYVERRYGAFSRSVRLPFEASDQNVKADFEKGVLIIKIPKPAKLQSKTKRIEVHSH